MSEFSESYHLRSGTVEATKRPMRRAGLRGYVLAPTGDWTTFVCAESNFEPLPDLIQVNEGTLLHYVYAEDHGWRFGIYDANNVVCTYTCDWSGDGVIVDDAGLDESVVRGLMSPGSPVSLEELRHALRPASFDDVIDNRASHVFAQAIGLAHFEWLSWHYVAQAIVRKEPHAWGPITVVG